MKRVSHSHAGIGATTRRRSGWPALILSLVLVSLMAGCGTVEPTIKPATPAAAPRPQTAVPTSTSASQNPLPTQPIETEARNPGTVVGALAPDITVVDLEGNRVRLSDLRGKRVLLNFWATWCPPCRAEMPELQAAHEKYGKDEFIILSVDYGESKAKVAQYAHDNKLTFLLALDESGDAIAVYGIRAIPTSFFIDRGGVIVAKQSGAMTKDLIERGLSRMP